MLWLWITLGVLAFLTAVVLIICRICFKMAFYSPDRKPLGADEYDVPMGEDFVPYHEAMEEWARRARATPHEAVSITSFDGLTLRGRFYEYKPGAPIELMFPGYRGTAERDLSGGIFRCFEAGRSALLVDQRSNGLSDGNVITFGIREHRDCLAWVDFMVKKFGPDVKIILTGISMGAATVLMAAGNPLPKNVIGVLADCGYNSPKEIIQQVIKGMGLPPKLAYPFVWLAARIYGGFNLEETAPEKAMKTCTVPVLFIHGAADDYVPAYMSEKNYKACAASKKKLVLIPKATHALAYTTDPETYLRELKDFFGKEAMAD